MKALFIKKANMWLVSEFTVDNSNKQRQKMNWFATEAEAEEFIKNLSDVEK